MFKNSKNYNFYHDIKLQNACKDKLTYQILSDFIDAYSKYNNTYCITLASIDYDDPWESDVDNCLSKINRTKDYKIHYIAYDFGPEVVKEVRCVYLFFFAQNISEHNIFLNKFLKLNYCI